MKLLTIIVPCYNSEGYMEKCIDSLLSVEDNRVEVLIIDDGSSDGTAALADTYQRNYPEIVQAIHQDNYGYGGAINTGLACATGYYVKVVDSDDWVDTSAFRTILETLAGFVGSAEPVDLVINNYVYEKEGARFKKTMRYTTVLLQDKVLTWKDVKPFRLGQYLMAHSLIYRTELLRECGLRLPRHTFYVDHLIVCVPLAQVKRLFYVDVDLYHYFIGRDDQSVNEAVIIDRLDQQFRVNKLVVDYWRHGVFENGNAREYIYHHLEIVTMISSVFALRSGKPENQSKREELWEYIRCTDERLYRRLRRGIMGVVNNLPFGMARPVSQSIYWISQKIYGFN